MGLYYLGAFPPGYGGVTVKNMNLYEALSMVSDIKRIDFNKVKRKNVKETVRLAICLTNRNNTFVVGVSGKKTRKRFSKLLYTLNRTAMNRSIIIVMGGTASNDMVNDMEYKKYVAEYKRIYVETEGMKKTLENAGLDNSAIYPNCRFKPSQRYKEKSINEGKLKCVFFSLIQPEKGTNIILDAAKSLPQVSFTFYGHIVEDYRECFLNSVEEIENVSYAGVFCGTSEETYAELRNYDVLLFPTNWNIEGVPGILVEAKIAGIPSIVSDKSYNSELVRDGYEGVVLLHNSSSELIEAIELFDNNRQLLCEMSKNSLYSAERFFIENYEKNILEDII